MDRKRLLMYTAMIASIIGINLILLPLASLYPKCAQQLRIKNISIYPLEQLKIWFPDELVVFGSIPPHTTSAYVTATKGVYRYSAFQFTLNDEKIHQPVIDFLGEKPIEGCLFTYVLDYPEVEYDNRLYWRIRLVEVNRDG